MGENQVKIGDTVLFTATATNYVKEKLGHSMTVYYYNDDADKSYEIVAFINDLLNDINMKFKIELLMLPDWATQNKIYMINMEYYTHMKIKNSLLEGVSE